MLWASLFAISHFLRADLKLENPMISRHYIVKPKLNRIIMLNDIQNWNYVYIYQIILFWMNVLPSLDSLYLGLDWIFIYIPSKSSILTQKIPLQVACLLCFFMCLLSSDCLRWNILTLVASVSHAGWCTKLMLPRFIFEPGNVHPNRPVGLYSRVACIFLFFSCVSS